MRAIKAILAYLYPAAAADGPILAASRLFINFSISLEKEYIR